MNAGLLTALVRATNDGAVPAPYPGEDTHDYRLRAALAGASVTLAYLREQAAAEAKAAAEQAAVAEAEQAVDVVLEDPPEPVSQGRPSDVTVTSPVSADNPVTAAMLMARRREPEFGVD